MNNVIPIISSKRECGECTKCCEGYLTANIHGHSMYKGSPCFYLEKGCTIYNDRPIDPCHEYNCYWLENDELPMWMKPSLSGVIVSEKVHQTDKNLSYFDITETGKKIDSTILNWIIHWALGTKKNIIYEVDGKMHRLGSKEFNEKLNSL